MPFRLKDFAFFYSLQVGVVVFSVLGMVIHTVALLKYFHSSVTETSPKNTVCRSVCNFADIYWSWTCRLYTWTNRISLGTTNDSEGRWKLAGGRMCLLDYSHGNIILWSLPFYPEGLCG